MTTHHTLGIVLRAVKYGETSLIATVYTELFGIKSYIIKGVRMSGKKKPAGATFFQPGAILDLVVYNNELKDLQFVKEYGWGYLYQEIFFNVVRHSVALFVIEMVQHGIKQPEANPELFYLIADTLKQADKGSDSLVANLPLYFLLHFSSELGFQIQGEYSAQTPVLDLQEGIFTAATPHHPHYAEGSIAATISAIHQIQFYEALETIKLTKTIRQQVMQHLQQYMRLHIADFGELNTLQVLQQVLSS